jgi:hypothetical protein
MKLCCTCRQRPPRKAGRNCLPCHALANRKYRAKTTRIANEYLKKLEKIATDQYRSWPPASD